MVVWQGRIAEYSEISGFVDEADLQRDPQKSYGHRMVAIGSAARSGSARGNFYWKYRNGSRGDVKPYGLALPSSPAQAHVYEAVLIGGDPPVKGSIACGARLSPRTADLPSKRTLRGSSIPAHGTRRRRQRRCAPSLRRWRDRPMHREPGGARRHASIDFRDRMPGHGASGTGETQVAASDPDAGLGVAAMIGSSRYTGNQRTPP